MSFIFSIITIMSDLTKQQKLELLKQQLAELEEEPEVVAEPEVSDDDVQKPKKPRKPMKKYERTDKQKEAMKRALDARNKNVELRRQKRDAEAVAENTVLQEKLIAKAIALKKKQIKKEKNKK